MARRRRRKRRNPGFWGDTLFQIVVGVSTAVIAAMAIDKLREAREKAPLPRPPAEGMTTT